MAPHVQYSSLRTTDPDSSGLIVMARPPQENSLHLVAGDVLNRLGEVIEWFSTRIEPPVSVGIVMGVAGGTVIAVVSGAGPLAAAALVLGCGAAGGAGGCVGNRPGFFRD